MTRTLPNVPLWPRLGRSGRSAATPSSSSLVASAGKGSSPGAAGPPFVAVPRPNPIPPVRRSVIGPNGHVRGGVGRAESLDTGQDPALAVVEPGFDVEREEIAPAGGPDPEGDRHRIVRFVGDRHGDPAHAQLLGPRSPTPMAVGRRR